MSDAINTAAAAPMTATPGAADQPQGRGTDQQSLSGRYAALLHRAVFARDAQSTEDALAAAANLGRDLMARDVPLEEIGEMHHEALSLLARAHPELTLAEVAGRVTMPLIEVSMAYSLAFRQQLEQRAQAAVNARLEQSRRLEAIGTLAAGIAHDFNNLLGSIIGFSDLIGDDLPADCGGQRYLELVQQASFRARDLISRMLTFAREMSDHPEPVELVALIQDTLKLLQASLPPGIALSYESPLEHAWVLAEASQLQQIVMNLCINAADAMNNEHGSIRIGLELAPARHASHQAAAPPLHLSVSDDGEGMSAELRERVFDPFYTTKEPGKGSGLGLSVVHGLVGKLGGRIDLQSTPGQGTRFIIELPQLPPEASGSHAENTT
jgi:signal transduction histidine kinase